MQRNFKLLMVFLGVAFLAGCSTLPQPRGPITHINPEPYYDDEPNKGHQVKVPAHEKVNIFGKKDTEHSGNDK